MLLQLFGATYMVVAPEHPLVAALTAPGRAEEVTAYVEAAASKSDLERTELAKGKSGVDTGAPRNGLKIERFVLKGLRPQQIIV